jgi:hypothetical protein
VRVTAIDKVGLTRGGARALGHVASGPVQPAVARFDVQRWGAEHQEGEPLVLVVGDITQRGADDGGIVQVVLALEQVVEAGAFGLVDEAQVDLVQQDGFGWTMLGKMVTKMKCHAASRAEGERMRQ